MIRDPFAGRSHPYMDAVATFIARTFNMPTLPLHFHEVLVSALAYHLICSVVSPMVSKAIVPRIYNNLSRRTRVNWDVHVVSLLQSTGIIALALYTMFADHSRPEFDFRARIWGYTGSAGLIQALATGYFLWDLIITAAHINLFGFGLLAHAISALAVYGMGYRPFVNFYAPVFILYESSSPFLNVHWFCDKLNMTGSDLQLYNGVLLILTFFASRLVWGTLSSVRVFTDIWRAIAYQDTVEGAAWMAATAARTAALREQGLPVVVGEAGDDMLWAAPPQRVPVVMAALYLSSNLVLNGLNVYWFGKMIGTLRARFEAPWGTRPKGSGNGPQAMAVKVEKGVDMDGVKSVEVSGSETKKRATTRRRG